MIGGPITTHFRQNTSSTQIYYFNCVEFHKIIVIIFNRKKSYKIFNKHHTLQIMICDFTTALIKKKRLESSRDSD